MLNFQKTFVGRSIARTVASPALITAEGLPLVADATVDGGVAAGTGSGSEVFVGISYSMQKPVLQAAHVAEVVVAADGTFSLPFPRASNTNCRFALVNGATETGLALTATTPGSPTAAETEPVGGSAQNFKTNASNNGKTIRAYFRYAPTVAQAQMLQGDAHPGGDASLLINSVGVITQGDVYTDQYDASADWSAGTALRISTTGLITNTGSGALLTGARLIARPTAAFPFIGVSVGNNG